MTQTHISIGIDISKHFFDVYILQHKLHKRFENSAEGIEKLLHFLSTYKQNLWRIVIEPSGGYEQELFCALLKHRLPVSMVPAQRIRYFARSQKDLAKTDLIDAQVLAVYGHKMHPELSVLKTEPQQKLTAWTRRRDALRNQLFKEKGRLDKGLDPEIVACIQRVCSFLEDAIARADKGIDEILTTFFAKETKVLKEVLGVGPQTVSKLLGELPEIGKTESQYIVRMAGLAPMNNESGLRCFKRSIRGGRKPVRNVLYMAALAAVRSNEIIGSFYRRLQAKGKPHKVAITACMRKLLRILNGRLLNIYSGKVPY